MLHISRYRLLGPGRRHAVGIDIGRGSTKIGLVSEAEQIVDRCRIFHGADDHGDQIAQVMANAVKDLMSHFGGMG